MRYLYLPLTLFVSSLAHAAANKTYLQADFGLLQLKHNNLQLGQNTSRFDLVDEGEQDTLSPYQRWTLRQELANGQLWKLVYQPLEFQSRASLQRDLLIEDKLFRTGETTSFRYSFPYTRFSYLWPMLQSEKSILRLGAGLQIRNARTEVSTAGGETFVSRSGVGPVPVFALGYDYQWDPKLRLSWEAEGNYAEVKWINGDSDEETLGGLLDSSLGFQYSLSESLAWSAQVRGVAGGSRSDKAEDPKEDLRDYSSNWIGILSYSVGLQWQLEKS